MRSSNFIIVPKPNLWSLSSSVAYKDLYITPFNYDLECNRNEAVQHKSREEQSLNQIVSGPIWSATRFSMIDAIASCDSRANDRRAKVETSFANDMIKCLEVFDIFNGWDTLAYWVSGRFLLMKVSFQGTPFGQGVLNWREMIVTPI